MMPADEKRANTLDQLVEALTLASRPSELYRSPDGSRVLVLPHGGRILGLFPPGSQENFLWTHPALRSAETASEFYASGVWQNSGGDRTWLAPEADFFFPDFPSLDRYWQPRELDPGSYRAVKNGDDARSAAEVPHPGVELRNCLALKPSRLDRTVVMEITKRIGAALNPLRYEPWFQDLENVDFAGYTLRTSLRLLDGAADAAVGLWNLLQMPHGGELFVPTHSRTEPKIYMGNISPEHLAVSDHLVRYRMCAAGEHKIGLRAVELTGRAGYLYPAGQRSALIIRNFSVNPSGEYVDVPWRETHNLGFSLQACNVNSSLGSFSELEYHVPAAGKGTGRTECTDVSQVWAFRGSRDTIHTIARRLVSAEA